MENNPHYTEAEKTAKYFETRIIDADADVIALGQMNATLAVATELRTANRLAAQAVIQQRNANIIAAHAYLDHPQEVADLLKDLTK
jgi:hypothetical protein